MSMRCFLSALLLCLVINLSAQDAYHSELITYLNTEHGLPAPDWVFFDSESAIISGAIGYGHNLSVQNATDQPFSQKTRHVLANPGNNPWDAGWNIRNRIAIQQNDILMAVFYIRSVDGPGKVNFFVENTSTFAKEVILTLDVSEEWRRYLVPFSAGANYAVDNLGWGFHLAFEAQTIEVGGFTALNFDQDANLEDLPEELNNEFYNGWEADAPWRAAAAERIEALRKTDLNIQVTTTSGEVVPNALVEVEMQAHEFAFGSAITAVRLPGADEHNVIYSNKILDLDGQGHGFNWVVFENDLKWPAWEEEWFVDKTELVNGIEWLVDNDIKIRGHTLVWPGSGNLPSDIPNNAGNIPYIQDRIDAHLQEILTYPGVGEHIAEWDVLNETVTNRFLENTLQGEPGYSTGREIYAEIFDRTREIDANTGLWINDYVTITLANEAGNPQYEFLKSNIQELQEAGVDIEGIGFQGHVGGFPNGIPEVLAVYDAFYDSFGLKAKITEFDLPPIVNEELAATYLHDFLTATFSHPSMNGFLFWSFWDGATYMNYGVNLFRLDWTPTPALDAFNQLVFNDWWTDEAFTTDVAGEVQERVFKGRYLISYTCDDELQTEEIDITEATTLTISCDNILTNTSEASIAGQLNIYPNPTNGVFNIVNPVTDTVVVKIRDASGRVVRSLAISDNTTIDIGDLAAGTYVVELQHEGQLWIERITRL